MISDLLKRLLAPTPLNLPDEDARLALCALLVRLARADDRYDDAERDRIDRILRTRYALDTDAAHILREQGEALDAEAPDTVRFTRAIKDAVPLEGRAGVVEALWQVALSDGERDAGEDALIRLASNLLGVNDVDSAKARQRAEAKL